MFWCSTEVTNYSYPGQSQSLQKYLLVPSVPGGRDGASPASLHSVSWTQREQEALLPWPSVTEQGPGSGNLCHDLCLCHPMYSLLSAKTDRLSAACPKPSWGAVNHHCLHLLTLPSEGAGTPTTSACRPQHSYRSHRPAIKRWPSCSRSEAAASSHHWQAVLMVCRGTDALSAGQPALPLPGPSHHSPEANGTHTRDISQSLPSRARLNMNQ